MANPSTSQIRQQGTRRPFQPLDTTEGRAGRAIAEPQEQYAGGWAVATDTIRNLSGVFGDLFQERSKKNELNPIAADMWAEASIEAEVGYQQLDQESRDKLRRAAAIAGQTEHEYFKTQVMNKTYQAIDETGLVSPSDNLYARGERFKPDMSGFQTVETRQYDLDKKILDTMASNNTAVHNKDGTINIVATLKKGYETIKAAETFTNNSIAESAMASLNITPEMYENSAKNASQRRAYDAAIANAAFDITIRPLIVDELQSIYNALQEGADPTRAIEKLTMDANEARRKILSGYYPSKDIQDNLLNQLSSFETQAKTLLSAKGETKTYYENQLAVLKARLQLHTLRKAGIAGDLARAAVSNPGSDQLLYDFLSYSKKRAEVGQILLNEGASLYNIANNMTDQDYIELNNQLKNVEAIQEGATPTHGTSKDISIATAFTNDQAIKKLSSVKSFSELSEKEQSNIRGNLAVTLYGAEDSVNGRPGVTNSKGEKYANFLEKMTSQEFLEKVLADPNNLDLKESYVNLTPSVVRSSLPLITDVIRNSTNENQSIVYDEKTKQFINTQSRLGPMQQAQDLLLPGSTTTYEFDRAVQQINTCLKALINARQLQQNGPLSEEQEKEVVDFIKSLLQTRIPERKMMGLVA